MGYTLQIHGRKLNLSLEPAFWKCFKEIAVARRQTISGLAIDVLGNQTHANMTAVFRVFILDEYRGSSARAALKRRCE